MHELPISQSILEIALRHAADAGASRILSLNLAIGQLSSVVDDSVQFYWEILTKDTPAEGSVLIFRRIPTELQCLDCDRRYSPTPDEMACPDCSSQKIKIVAGKEFFLESIDVE